MSSPRVQFWPNLTLFQGTSEYKPLRHRSCQNVPQSLLQAITIFAAIAALLPISEMLLLQVYPFVKKLRAWIRKEKGRLNGGKAGRGGHKNGVARHNGNTGSSSPEDEIQKSSLTDSAPLEQKKSPEPGQTWINFKFCHDDIMKHLVS